MESASLGIAVAAALMAVASAVWNVWKASQVAGEAALQVHADLVHAIEAEQLKTSGLRAEAHEFFDRAESARARATAAASNATRRERAAAQAEAGEGAGPQTRQEYLTHLRNGGRADPEIEARLGIRASGFNPEPQ